MIGRGLTYEVAGDWSGEVGHARLDDLSEGSGLGASWAGVSGHWGLRMYFDFSCGCEDCPQLETVEEARELVETTLTERGLEWTFVEEFDLDGD